jgi:hypothetical protein
MTASAHEISVVSGLDDFSDASYQPTCLDACVSFRLAITHHQYLPKMRNESSHDHLLDRSER